MDGSSDNRGVLLDELTTQVAAMTDVMTTVVAALVTQHLLPAALLQRLIAEGDLGKDASDGDRIARVSAATASIARDALMLSGYIAMPSPVRLVHSMPPTNDD